MYFSGEESKEITYDDPDNQCIRVNAELYSRVQIDNEQNTRVFLDTHLLRIRDDEAEQESSSVRIVAKSDASISVGAMPLMSLVVYITDALMTAEFREMSSDGFKKNYLAPLDNSLKERDIGDDLLSKKYVYPFGDASHVEDHIQQYFNEEIAGTIKRLYRDVSGKDNYFGKPSMIRSLLDRKRVVKPDIAHILKKGSFLNLQIPEICFAIGDYKNGTYNLAQGFEELTSAVQCHIESLQSLEKLRLHSRRMIFPNKEWSPRVLFALVLRKYLYQAFLCGTDRVFISDHQSFSGFFRYEIADDKMTVEYYVINDPESIAHGITLRSAIAGFFYKNVADAQDTKGRFIQQFDVASKTKGLDPFKNVLPRQTSGASRKSSGNEFAGDLESIDENPDRDDTDEIRGNTYCRIIYDTAKRYPNLKLPSTVFTKLYYYSSRLWEENDLMCLTIPEKKGYYDMFFNELVINEKIAKSPFASSYPKLLVSGYWNGLPDHPMHIFENLGKEVPEEEWDKKKVYEVIKSRLEELHLLGISHNDVREANIHVSVSGKISLIDFGLSDCTNNEKHKKNDFESLDEIIEILNSSENGDQVNKDSQENEGTDKAETDSKYGSYINSSEEAVFDEMSLASLDTRTTKEDINSKGSHRQNK
ncbi:MAG: DUF3698 domain-containing protein [Staphylococcus equorum]|nr:DUF3698 domain-containing protein [Staphylococcus equorum]